MSSSSIIDSEHQINSAISKATDFLAQNQLSYGEFKTYFTTDKKLIENFIFDSSPFVTALILYCISFSEDAKISDVKQKAVQFLLEEKEKPLLWRYWSSRNVKHEKLPLDLDDTACISYVLKQYYSPILYSFLFTSNHKIILNNRNENGIFYTWINPPGYKNNIDSAVNANVLLYLGECQETKLVIDYLNHLVLNDCEQGSYPYYLNDLCLYYFMSRAYFHGVLGLEESKDTVLRKTISLQKEDGSFGNELNTALAVAILLNYKSCDFTTLERGIQSILSYQQADGCWSKIAMITGCFWTGGVENKENWLKGYWGSEELTTALCIEALTKYQLCSTNN